MQDVIHYLRIKTRFEVQKQFNVKINQDLSRFNETD